MPRPLNTTHGASTRKTAPGHRAKKRSPAFGLFVYPPTIMYLLPYLLLGLSNVSPLWAWVTTESARLSRMSKHRQLRRRQGAEKGGGRRGKNL